MQVTLEPTHLLDSQSTGSHTLDLYAAPEKQALHLQLQKTHQGQTV